MRYLPLITLEIAHPYYVDGRCPDFHIAPTPETLKMLSGLRCVLKSFSHGICVSAAVDAEGMPFVTFPLETLFTFHLRLRNADFGLFTELEGFNQLTAPLYTNSSSDTELILTSRDAAPFPATGIFAEVDIRYAAPSSLSKGAAHFRIAFKSKQARWKYYLVMDKTDSRTLDPVLEDKGNGIAFNVADRTDLTLYPDPEDGIALKLAKRYPDRQYFRFRSSEVIACQEAVRKSIQLKLGNDKVIDCLPNPRIQNFSIDTLTIGSARKGAIEEYSIYHVVEYFTR